MFRVFGALTALVVVAVLTTLPTRAIAQTINEPGPGGGTSFLRDFQTPLGQVVTAPSALPLQSFSFLLNRHEPNNATVTPRVSNWAGGARGAVIWTGTPVAVTDPAQMVFTFQTGGIPVVAGQQYALELLNSSANPVGVNHSIANGYAGGGAVQVDFENVNLDFTFTAVFAAPVPTLTEWGMILFGLSLVGAALVVVRRRVARTS